MKRSRLLSVIALSVSAGCLLAGCTVGPDYRPPVVAVPPSFAGAPGDRNGAQDITVWWHGFGDPLLDRLIEQGLRDNPDVRQAAMRIEEARAQERAVRSNGGPKINASAQAGYNQLSSNALPSGLANLGTLGAGRGASALGLAGEHFTTFQTGFDASGRSTCLAASVGPMRRRGPAPSFRSGRIAMPV
jgi:outer membrane protein TolC